MKHFVYIPFTGLGLYGGFRGNRWLRNRIQIFKQFVFMSLLNQTNQDFILWVSWRKEERTNKYVNDLYSFLVSILGEHRVVFTYAGVCFWDDKYPEEEAHSRLLHSLHSSLQTLIDYTADADEILMTIQPSDDCYYNGAFEEIRKEIQDCDAVGYSKGYIMNYQTKETRTYNPKTNPPFFTIKFKKEDFIDPFKHAKHTGPYKSHEYIGDFLKYKQIHVRGFLVGTHGENISTHYKHPYAGDIVPVEKIEQFGILDVPKLQIRYSLRKQIMRKLPHGWQRKLRYIFGEKLYARFYSFIRN